MNNYLELNKRLCERRSKARTALKSAGFTVEQFIALWAVKDKPLSQIEVCSVTGLLAPSLVRMVDFLFENKFAEQLPSDDLRYKPYRPTKKGRSILKRYSQVVSDALEGMEKCTVE